MSGRASVPPLAVRQRPGLSETLEGPKAPDYCQGCGIGNLDHGSGRRWIECDAVDRPTAVVLVLCAGCSTRLIRPHARLYVAEDWWAPRPGAMPCCARCQYREDLECTSSQLKARGGPGLSVGIFRDCEGIMCGTGGCRPLVIYRRPSDCKGFTLRRGRDPAAAAEEGGVT